MSREDRRRMKRATAVCPLGRVYGAWGCGCAYYHETTDRVLRSTVAGRMVLAGLIST